MTPEQRGEFLKKEAAQAAAARAEYLRQEAIREKERASKEWADAEAHKASVKFWKEIGFYMGLPLLAAGFVAVWGVMETKKDQ